MKSIKFNSPLLFVALLFSSFVYALPEVCSYSDVMDNQEIDKEQIAACPTQWAARAISRFVKKQYWQNQPLQSFADLGEKVSLVSFFSKDLFVDTLAKSNSKDPVFKNFIELY